VGRLHLQDGSSSSIDSHSCSSESMDDHFVDLKHDTRNRKYLTQYPRRSPRSTIPVVQLSRVPAKRQVQLKALLALPRSNRIAVRGFTSIDKPLIKELGFRAKRDGKVVIIAKYSHGEVPKDDEERRRIGKVIKYRKPSVMMKTINSEFQEHLAKVAVFEDRKVPVDLAKVDAFEDKAKKLRQLSVESAAASATVFEKAREIPVLPELIVDESEPFNAKEDARQQHEKCASRVFAMDSGLKDRSLQLEQLVRKIPNVGVIAVKGLWQKERNDLEDKYQRQLEFQRDGVYTIIQRRELESGNMRMKRYNKKKNEMQVRNKPKGKRVLSEFLRDRFYK